MKITPDEAAVLKVARLRRPWVTARDCGHVGPSRKVRLLLRNMIRRGLLSPLTAYHRVGGTVVTAYREPKAIRPVALQAAERERR